MARVSDRGLEAERALSFFHFFFFLLDFAFQFSAYPQSGQLDSEGCVDTFSGLMVCLGFTEWALDLQILKTLVSKGTLNTF